MDQMNATERKLNEEIIRRAIEQSDFQEQEKEKLLKQRDIIDALEEVTDLPRVELEKIAREVRESFTNGGEAFFSIKHQIILATLIISAVLSIIAFVVWLF